jgi:hypothetical protein
MCSPLRILDEHKTDIEGACELLGTADNPVHPVTVLRAMNRGGRTPTGARVYLEHLHTGGKIITSREAIERYLAALNGIDLDGASAVEEAPMRRTKARQRELDRVDAELAAVGI